MRSRISKSCASRGEMATGEEPKGACARLCGGARASGDAESEPAGEDADAGRRRRQKERRPGEGRGSEGRGGSWGEEGLREERRGEGAREAAQTAGARTQGGGGSWGKEGCGEGKEGRGEGARRG